MSRGSLASAALAGSVAGGALVKKLWLAKYKEQGRQLAGMKRERDLFYTWLMLKEKGVKIAEYFSAHAWTDIAILGMNLAGRRLYEELQGQGELRVVYGAEAECLGAVHKALTVYRLGEDLLPSADCMVVCDLDRAEEKAEAARRAFSGETVLLTNVLAQLLERHGIGPGDGAIEDWPR